MIYISPFNFPTGKEFQLYNQIVRFLLEIKFPLYGSKKIEIHCADMFKFLQH